MQAAPIPSDETARLAALRQLQVLDTGPEPTFDRIVALARDVLRAPIAAVSLVDRERQWFKSSVGFCVEQTSRGIAFCAHAILGDEVMVVPDATLDPRFADNPLVTGGPGVRFYAAAPIRTLEGHAVGALCIIDHAPRTLSETDAMTLRRLADIAADALNARVATIRAEKEGRATSHFIAGMGHELRTPLTAILGFTDLLADDDIDTAQRREFLGTIRRNGRQLLAVVNDMLDYSRVEAGTLSVDQRPFPVADLVAEVQRDIQPLAREKNLRFAVDIDARAATTLYSDPARVRQVLATLAANAVRLTDRGSVTLCVRPAAEVGQIRFDIVDTGPGLTPEQAARLFKPAGPADAAPTRRLAGMALGLRVSQLLTRLLHGEIGVVSTPGVGSIFSVTLPTFQPGHSLPAIGPGMMSEPDAGPRPLARVRVLVVDDHIDTQRLLSLQLRQAGAVVALAGSGNAAIDALTAQGAWPGDPGALPHFDMVLLSMPALDGYAAARALREMNHPTPIIALTSAATEEDSQLCAELGCAGYLAKPVAQGTLISTIRHLLMLAAPSAVGV
ncbi:MAG: response regulator [Phycisphaerales bacterium]|nr:response regulator [Phycisphaerales bacterium]